MGVAVYGVTRASWSIWCRLGLHQPPCEFSCHELVAAPALLLRAEARRAGVLSTAGGSAQV